VRHRLPPEACEECLEIVCTAAQLNCTPARFSGIDRTRADRSQPSRAIKVVAENLPTATPIQDRPAEWESHHPSKMCQISVFRCPSSNPVFSNEYNESHSISSESSEQNSLLVFPLGDEAFSSSLGGASIMSYWRVTLNHRRRAPGGVLSRFSGRASTHSTYH
jgi:hypothetical protein